MATKPKPKKSRDIPENSAPMRPGRHGGLLKTGGVNPGSGRPPVKHIRERILELIADGVIDQDKLIHELRSEDRALFLAYAYGRPQADLTSGGKPIAAGVLVIGPKELENV